jgi:hypothetical protein
MNGVLAGHHASYGLQSRELAARLAGVELARRWINAEFYSDRALVAAV